jgi:hypothetical protein
VGVVVTVAGVLLAYAFLLYVLEQHTGGELTIVVKRGLAAIVLLLGAVAFVVGRFVRSRR